MGLLRKIFKKEKEKEFDRYEKHTYSVIDNSTGLKVTELELTYDRYKYLATYDVFYHYIRKEDE